jgi:hypothetical protein
MKLTPGTDADGDPMLTVDLSTKRREGILVKFIAIVMMLLTFAGALLPLLLAGLLMEALNLNPLLVISLSAIITFLWTAPRMVKGITSTVNAFCELEDAGY